MNLRRLAPLAALVMLLSSQVWAAKQTGDAADRKAIPSAEAGIAQLLSDTSGSARVSLHDATGAARFVRLGSRTSAPGQAAAKAPATIAATTMDLSRTRSREFLSRHGAVFGVRDSLAELVEAKADTDFMGGTHITYEQRYQGLPVFAGELKSHFNASGELTVVNGTFIPEIEVNPTPTLTARTASREAVNKVRADLGRAGLSPRRSELVVFREGLAKGVPGANHLAFRVEVGNGGDVREFVFIDAHSGKFIEQFTGIHDALNRRAYDGAGANPGPNYPGSPLWVEGQLPFPTGTLEADNMILASGETHGLFSNGFGRDSFDGAGAIMHAIFNRGGAGQCPNASWNGEYISFCPGITTDDVTGHEWTHAYTEYTHNLIYAWQPGALNEAYSDIFGETIDRINARDAVVRPNTPRTDGSCSIFSPGPGTDNSERWLMGEDSTAVGLVGALRDMWNPTCYGDPGKVSDAQYTCDPAFTDQGGVHTNSGVVNHAYALLVDGGTYNSQTITAIGLTKAAHIYFRAMNVYQTLSSDFVDHADALEASCTDLIGVNLADLLTGAPSGEILNAGNCAQVTSAIGAVQLRTPPTACNFQPLLAKNPPNRCEVGSTQTTALFEDFELGSAGWTVSSMFTGTGFTPRDWVRTNGLPNARPGFAFFGSDPTSGTCAPGGDESAVLQLESPNIIVPAGAAPRLTFDHWVATEAGWDGGNVKISVNGGPFTLIARADYTFNPYNLTAMNTAGAGNTSPLEGQPGFSGTDAGSVSGSWGRSHVNLGPYAAPGATVKLRFDFGSDGCGGAFGWYVDDVSVHACVVVGPEIAVTGNTVDIADGDNTPSLADHTDFGTVDIAGAMMTRTFTIQNLGTGNLTLGALSIGGPDAADFALTSAPPASPVLPLGSTTFQITFDPSAIGTRSATLSLVNDDPDENPFDFSIQGTGFTPPPATIFNATEVEPNGTVATAMALPVASGGAVRLSGNVFPSTDVDFYSFTATAGDRVYAATMTSASANGSSDSQITLLGSDGITAIEFDDDNGSMGGFSSSIAGASIPASGTYYLKINHFTAATGQLRGYDLYLQVRSGAPTPETESNDTPGTANAGITWASGARNPAVGTEQDWYSMTLNAGDTVFLSLDVDPERDATSWNGRLGMALFGDGGNQILVVDDAGTADTPPQIPSEAMFLTVKDAGTYFAFVDSASAATGGPTATYNLNITVFPRVPVGVNPTTYTSTDVPKTIGPGAGLVSSTITVPGNPRIASIRVTLDLNHAQMADLDVHLRSPAGNDIGLFTDIGAAAPGGQTQMVTTFAGDAGVTPIFTVLKGLVVRPELAYRLHWLNGEDAGGAWTLDIRDDFANVSGGTLNGWSIEISEMPAPPAGGTVFSTDFESGAAGFTHSGAADEWELGLPATLATITANPIAGFSTANSGVNAWKTDLDNTYDASSSQDLLSPNINLAAAAGPVTLAWAQKYQMQSATNDHAYVEVQEVGGAGATRKVWEWLDATMTDAPGNPAVNIGASAGWGLVRADISDFAGKTIRVVFHLDSDAATNFGGWAIDDFSVSAVIAPTVTTPTTGSISQTSVVLGGTVASDNGSSVTERGVVYSQTSLDSDPVIGAPNATKVIEGSGLGAFTTPVTGLALSTGYSFKAYAINAQGTGYTTPASTFTTLACPVITLAALPNGTVGTPYSASATASGGSGSYTYAVTAGSLPAGLTLVGATVSGMPLAAGSFQITATDTAPPGTCTGVGNFAYIGSAVAAKDLVIREFRSRGPAGAEDEYVVIHNRTAAPIAIAAQDASGGYAVAKEGGTLVFTIPNGTVIPAKGHFLGANITGGTGFSLGVAPNAPWNTDIGDGVGLGLFKSNSAFNAGTELDAVGFTAGLFAEGAVLPPLGPTGGEYAWIRKAPGGVVQDTDANLGIGANPGDFTLVATDGALYNAIQSALGAPTPTGLNTWDTYSGLTIAAIEPNLPANYNPNRIRKTDAPGGGDRLEFRRRITNNTGATINTLRLRFTELTTFNSPGYTPGITQADLRPNTSLTVSPNIVTSLGSVAPVGLTLGTPPAQPAFGGLNSILTIPGGLANGASVDVNIALKIFRVGGYRFFATVEAQP